MTDDPKVTLTDGSPVTPEHLKIDTATGQQRGYLVLSEAERRRGFVRPLRDTYVHRGIRPKYPLRQLTDAEREDFKTEDYAGFEEYPVGAPESHGGAITGRYWTRAQLESGCGTQTRMGIAIAETYARDPKFYGGTFCCGCRRHLPLEEFIWFGTDEVVGS